MQQWWVHPRKTIIKIITESFKALLEKRLKCFYNWATEINCRPIWSKICRSKPRNTHPQAIISPEVEIESNKASIIHRLKRESHTYIQASIILINSMDVNGKERQRVTFWMEKRRKPNDNCQWSLLNDWQLTMTELVNLSGSNSCCSIGLGILARTHTHTHACTYINIHIGPTLHTNV